MRKILALVLILLLPGLLPAQTTAIPPARPVVFTHVTVIDVTGAPSKSNMTVIVAGNSIAAVGKTGKIRIPKDAEVIDASGKFLIPGLWDMHAHALTDNRYEWAFPLLIANGVTGVRDMGSNLAPQQTNEIRRNVADGKILAPRFGALTYRILDGAGTQIDIAAAVTNPDEARQFVRDYKRLGADFIKPYNLLSRETYLAMVDEARRQKIPLAGHVPFSMTAAEVSDLGQTTIEHNFGVLYSASLDEDEILKELRAAPNRWAFLEAKAAATFDEKKAALFFKRLAKNGTWVCPTIIVYRQIIHWDDEVFLRATAG